MDEQQRARLEDDLKGFFKGELLFDDLSRALYSTDASIFQIQPIGAVAPRDEAEVQALVRFAADNKLPLIARGAGTGVAGESLGAGLVVDLSRHFRAITAVERDTGWKATSRLCGRVAARAANHSERCGVGGFDDAIRQAVGDEQLGHRQRCGD